VTRELNTQTCPTDIVTLKNYVAAGVGKLGRRKLGLGKDFVVYVDFDRSAPLDARSRYTRFR